MRLSSLRRRATWQLAESTQLMVAFERLAALEGDDHALPVVDSRSGALRWCARRALPEIRL